MAISAISFCIGGTIGLLFPYRKINHWIGYRVALARKSQQHWDFAQIIFAKNMLGVGVCFLILAIWEGLYPFFPPWGLFAESSVAVLIPILGVISTHLRLMKFDRDFEN